MFNKQLVLYPRVAPRPEEINLVLDELLWLSRQYNPTGYGIAIDYLRLIYIKYGHQIDMTELDEILDDIFDIFQMSILAPRTGVLKYKIQELPSLA